MQALLTDVHLLILDEPLSGLDPNSQQELEHILLSLKQQGISILFTCHEKQLLENFADRIVTLANHTITENISAQKGAEQVYIEAIVHETFSAIELQNNPVLYTLHTIQIKTLFNYKSKKNIQTKCFSFIA